MHYKTYEKFLHDRGIDLSSQELSSLISLFEAVSDYAAHLVEADIWATGRLVQELNEAMESANAPLRFKIEKGTTTSERPDQK